MTDTTTLNQRVINRINTCKEQRLHPNYRKHTEGLFDFSQACSHFNIGGFEFPNIEGIDMGYYEHTMSFVHFVGCSSFKMYFVGKKDGEWYGIEYDVPAFNITCNKLSDNFTFDGMKLGWEPAPVYVYEGSSHEIDGHAYFYLSDINPEDCNDNISDYEEPLKGVKNGDSLYLVCMDGHDYIFSVCKTHREAKSISSYETLCCMNDMPSTEYYVRHIIVELGKEYPYDQ